jgi:cytoskeletal protein CcmA (bactofilin family)
VALFRKDRIQTDVADEASGTDWQQPEPVRSQPAAKKERPVTLKTDEITTILGKGSEFEGKLQFEGTLRIEGVFSGEIASDSVLVVGEGARVDAEIDIGTIIINGEVQGNVRAKQGVELRGKGRLKGNLETPSLYIEKGVVFDGSCKMDDRSGTGAAGGGGAGGGVFGKSAQAAATGEPAAKSDKNEKTDKTDKAKK